MKLLARLVVMLSLLSSIVTFNAQAEDLSKLTDHFYAGLAQIIEQNMDNPQNCMREVDAYYQKNQATVLGIQSEMEAAYLRTHKAFMEIIHENKLRSQMGKPPISRAEEWAKIEKAEYPFQKNQTSQISESGVRYERALQEFAQKYPEEAEKIGMMSMRFVPGMNKHQNK